MVVDKARLIEAAKTGKLDELKNLLGDKPKRRDVDVKDEQGRTAFFFAVAHQKWEVAEALINPPYNASAKAMCNCCNTTALAKAAQFGRLDLIKSLIAKHAPVSQKNKFTNETAETLALRYGHLDCVETLRLYQAETLEELKNNALSWLIRFVNDSPGLNKFYGEENEEERKTLLKPKADRAAEAVYELLKQGVQASETVKKLSVLSLYKLAVLIDDSFSMQWEEEGKRIDALVKTVKAIVKMYSRLHSPTEGKGVHAIRFLNSHKKIDDVALDKLAVDPHPIRKHHFQGGTKLGSALRDHVLKPFVPEIDEENGPDLSEPLLVMVITDGQVDENNRAVLEAVLKKYGEKVERVHGRHSLAFQFARIGNDAQAKRFLEDLDSNKTCGKYVNVDSVGFGINDLTKTKSLKRRELVVDVLCGAIYKSDDAGEVEDDCEDEDENDADGIEDGADGDGGDEDDDDDDDDNNNN